eukprot:scaffold207293_cov46-Prasinocladus_malaysianus.AAC.1
MLCSFCIPGACPASNAHSSQLLIRPSVIPELLHAADPLSPYLSFHFRVHHAILPGRRAPGWRCPPVSSAAAISQPPIRAAKNSARSASGTLDRLSVETSQHRLSVQSSQCLSGLEFERR